MLVRGVGSEDDGGTGSEGKRIREVIKVRRKILTGVLKEIN